MASGPLLVFLLALLAVTSAPRRASAARDSSDFQGVLTALDSLHAQPGVSNERGKKEDPETLIFVDVDGVLNVFIGGYYILTGGYLGKLLRGGKPEQDDADHMMVAASKRKLPGDSFTYEMVANATDPTINIVGLYVQRLAEIVRAAGPGAKIVLSSNWRNPKPQHQKKVKKLETVLASKLERPSFKFDATTKLVQEVGVAQRVERIGEFVADFCEQRGGSGSQKLRILVLDDFSSTALDGTWQLDGRRVDSPQVVEEYLLSRARGFVAAAKLVHTYDGWVEEQGGMEVRVGCGLAGAQCCEALHFLGKGTTTYTIL